MYYHSRIATVVAHVSACFLGAATRGAVGQKGGPVSPAFPDPHCTQSRSTAQHSTAGRQACARKTLSLALKVWASG